MEKISNLTKKAFKSKKLDKAAQAAFVCGTAQKTLKDFFDKDFLKEVKVVSFRGGVLYLATTNNFYSQEIKLKEKEIVEGVNKKARGEEVKNIRFKGG